MADRLSEVPPSGQFEGRIAIVTGATQGLGEAVARLFARRGAAGIVIAGRNAERGEAVAASLAGASPDGSKCAAHFVRADFGDVDQVRTVTRCAKEKFGTVHHLVNCAAITDRGTILDTSPELFDAMFAVNVRAPFFLMQDAGLLMRETGVAGTVVNILSMSSHGGQPFISAYCGSKGALATLTRNVAFSLMRDRIRVNGLNIGWMDTPGEHRIQKEYHDAPAHWLENAESKQPFSRLLKPDEVARAVAFLSSEESGMMTGSLIDFDQSIVGAYDAPPQPSGL